MRRRRPRTSHAVALACLLVAISATPAQATTVSFTVGDLRFSLDPDLPPTDSNAGATLRGFGFRVSGSHLTIPVEIPYGGTEYPVKAIGESAFSPGSGQALTSVTVPDGVTTIGRRAFEQNHLTDLQLPDSVTTIGESAFEINPLSNLTLSNKVVSIGEGAFREGSLTTLHLPDSVRHIGNYAFALNNLRELSIPGSVTTIGAWAFVGNPDLTTVEFRGSAPATISPAGELGSSFDSGTGLTITYLQRHADSGFTTPTWKGYHTVALAVVDFDLAGHGTAPDPVQVPVDSLLPAPATPTADGYHFAGWYPTANPDPADLPFDPATTPITDDLTLYARWEATATINGLTYAFDPAAPATGATLVALDSGVTGPALMLPATITHLGATYAVTAIAGNTHPGPGLTTLTIPDTVTVIDPLAFGSPALTTVTFLGTAPTITAAGAGGSFGTGDGLTITYLQRHAGSGFTAPTWHGYDTVALAVVTFDGGGHGSVPDPVQVPVGTLLPAPPTPTADGYLFTGWYPAADPAASLQRAAAGPQPFDFTTPITNDLTLIAGWQAITTSTTPEPTPTGDTSPPATTPLSPTTQPTTTTTTPPATAPGPLLSKTGGPPIALAPAALTLLLLGWALVHTGRRRPHHR